MESEAVDLEGSDIDLSVPCIDNLKRQPAARRRITTRRPGDDSSIGPGASTPTISPDHDDPRGDARFRANFPARHPIAGAQMVMPPGLDRISPSGSESGASPCLPISGPSDRAIGSSAGNGRIGTGLAAYGRRNR